MSSKVGRSQKIKHSYTRIFVLTAALLIVAALIAAITLTQLGVFKGRTPAPANDPSAGSAPTEDLPKDDGTPSSESSDSSSPEQSGALREYINCTAEQLKEVNPLLIVDAEHPFSPSKAVGLVTIYGAAVPDGGKNPRPFTSHNQINKDALNAFQLLNGALDVQFGEEANLSILSAHTLLKSQKIENLYEIGLNGAQCSDKNLDDPAVSVHATGYAADIRYYKGNKSLDDHAEYTAKLLELCPTYGLVQARVIDGSLTEGYSKATRDHWHFRYVGVPHALYMTKNAMTFEQYMDALRKTNYNKDSRLSVAASDGTTYEMYFVKAEDSGNTRVPVPTGSSYSIAGNGVDGFIVTLTYPAASA